MLQFGLYLTRPLISNYAVSLGATFTLAGFLAGLMATAALIIRPISGIISDRVSKKSLLVASCILFAASALGCALFQSVASMGVFLSLQGFAFAFKSTVVVSLASLVVPKAKVGSGVGWLGLAYTVACALGPALGSFIGDAVGYPGAFIVSGLLLSAGLFVAILFEAPSGSHADGSRIRVSSNADGQSPSFSGTDEDMSQRVGRQYHDTWFLDKLKTCLYAPVIILSIIAGLLMVAHGATSSFILIIGEIRGIEGSSLYFLFYSLATLVARPSAGRASDAWGAGIVVVPMMIIAVLGMLFAAFMDSFLGIVLAGICMGMGQGSAYCTIQAESVRGVPENYLGRAANTFYLGPDLCMGLGPALGGWILQLAGVSAMFLFNALAIFVALLLFLGYVIRHRTMREGKR